MRSRKASVLAFLKAARFRFSLVLNTLFFGCITGGGVTIFGLEGVFTPIRESSLFTFGLLVLAFMDSLLDGLLVVSLPIFAVALVSSVSLLPAYSGLPSFTIGFFLRPSGSWKSNLITVSNPSP